MSIPVVVVVIPFAESKAENKINKRQRLWQTHSMKGKWKQQRTQPALAKT